MKKWILISMQDECLFDPEVFDTYDQAHSAMVSAWKLHDNKEAQEGGIHPDRAFVRSIASSYDWKIFEINVDGTGMPKVDVPKHEPKVTIKCAMTKKETTLPCPASNCSLFGDCLAAYEKAVSEQCVSSPARWIEHIHFDSECSPNGSNYECPKCHFDDVYDLEDYNFCPKCGTRLIE